MVLRTVQGEQVGEDTEDLRSWLRALRGPHPVTETVVLHCDRHGDEQPTWTYVEADAAAGLARRRCLSCASTSTVLGADESWTWPPMWACRGCGQSIAEVAAGLSTDEADRVVWVALGARCVECGRVAGLTDVVVDTVPLDQVLPAL